MKMYFALQSAPKEHSLKWDINIGNLPKAHTLGSWSQANLWEGGRGQPEKLSSIRSIKKESVKDGPRRHARTPTRTHYLLPSSQSVVLRVVRCPNRTLTELTIEMQIVF